jgi:hypothetical protein
VPCCCVNIINYGEHATINPRGRSVGVTYHPLFQGRLSAVMDYIHTTSSQALTGLEVSCVEFGPHPVSVAKALSLTRGD